MEVKLLACTPDGDALSGLAAATCTKSGNHLKALEHALKGGHESVIEHVSFTFQISGVSRALLAQLTRHRVGISFSVQSQRFCDMGEMPLVIPESIKENKELLNEFGIVMDAVKAFYHKAVKAGIPKEDARYVSPQAATTELVLSANARELKHFFSLRCCNRAQWEIRELADRMLAICKNKCPVIFADAGPGCVNDICHEERPCGNPRTFDELFGRANNPFEK